MSDIEVVVFDIGNVLIGWEPEQFYDSVIGAQNRDRLFAEVPIYEMNERVDLGADFAVPFMGWPSNTLNGKRKFCCGMIGGLRWRSPRLSIPPSCCGHCVPKVFRYSR